ncbi:M23 family metallopeptidase [Salirhabdus salicampi]|uniref:M23 family metallopeptidase n=1 Tax=Salirhabdus salicampi TaxID=476102 RepID=UPI0020C1E7A6|nr:M23 family metallopeptidase [Salirhabdus salicampi]MCP8617463.1 M23 family metallopeptidase [Salirhabdus salicampi]
MKEEGKNQNSFFKRLLQKKWFYPAVYLSVAALLLTAVIWYQQTSVEMPDSQMGNDELGSEEDPLSSLVDDEDTVPVMDQDEVLRMPVASAEETQIVTKFYDYDASTEEQEQALIFYDNKYYQSKGIDIASSNEETFDVMAALSGTVTNVKNDPLLGNVVELTHDYGVTTHYASLGDVSIDVGTEVVQGDVIGTAGRNLFGQANGIHVHFELRKDGTELNPEDFFNRTLSAIQLMDDEGTEEDGTEDDEQEEEEEDDGAQSEEDNSEQSEEEDTETTANA